MADEALNTPKQDRFGEQPSPGLLLDAAPDSSSSTPPTAPPPGGKIRAKSADGVIHQFPAGTAQDVVDKAMKTYAEEHANKTTTLGQMARGFMDPIHGGGQLLSEMMPRPVRETVEQFNNWLSKYTGGLITELPRGGENSGKTEQVRQREAEIQRERGLEKGNIDWPRMGGDVLNPVNYVGGGLIGGAGKIANVGRAVLGGVTASAVSPAAHESFVTEKTKQLMFGGLLGLGAGGLGLAASKGIDKVGEWMLRKNPEVLENEAVKKIIRRIAQDEKAGGPSATDMIELVETSSKPMVLADVGKSNVKGLAGNVARQPGESKAIAENLITKRDEQAAARLSADIDNFVHGGQTAHQATEGLITARSAASTPAYDAMHALEGIWSPRLQQFLDDPVVKTGLSRGYELERMISLAEGRPITATQMGVDLGVDGSIKLLGVPNMRLLDMGKRGLDAMIADERNAVTGRLSTTGKALNDVRKAYISEMDKLDIKGLYRKAREAWGGYSASMDAIKLGRAVFNMHPEEITAEVGRLSPGNAEFYRLGVADMLKERLAKVGLNGDEAKALIKNSWMRQQLQPAFRKPGDYDRFVDAVTQETQMFETGRKLLGNSATAERVAEDVAGQGVERAIEGGRVVSELARGHPIRAAVNAWRLYRDLGIKPNPDLNEKIAQILFAQDIPSDLAQKLSGNAVLDLANPLARHSQGVSAGSVTAATAGSAQQTGTR